jgi:two-component system, NtrC family, sensor kinase
MADSNRPSTGIILIVDDALSSSALLSDFLHEVGFKTAIAKNGEDAIEQVELHYPDLILLDLVLPGIDGFEICRQLKTNPRYLEIPIIFMTAIGDTETKVKGLSLGAVDYITKPFQKEELLARVKIQLQMRSLTKQLADRNQILQELKEDLEKKVVDRTAELQQAQFKLVQQEKMSALGQLIAGVAHEMNNPIGFISSNIPLAKESVSDLIRVLNLYQQHYPEPVEEILLETEAVDLEFLIVDLPNILASMQLGCDCLKTLSISLRNFSRLDTANKIAVNLHDGLDSTLVILGHRLKANETRPAIAVVKNYGELPRVHCYPGQLNQVFMNILANAIDAVDEYFSLSVDEDKRLKYKGKIGIRTDISPDRSSAIVRIQDNALGMCKEVQARIFDYLFTTKTVGKGTGLGLAVARQIVEEKHGGRLHCSSELGKGTVFTLEIPID